MIRSFCLAFTLLLAPAIPQEKQPAAPVQPSSAANTPTYPNPSCPIMGKPISTKLFADTEMGRIYICCKACVKDIQADVAIAYKTAYPIDKKIENKICPVTGGEITKESPTVVLQGFQFFLRSAGDIPTARANSQVVLARLNDPKLVDLENKTCPVTGEPTVKNAFVVIDGTIVRLSSAKLLADVAKDPPKVLKKAKEIRAQEDTERDAGKPQDGTKKP